MGIIFDFIARKQYGVPNFRDPNVMWPWWLEQQAKIRSGEIPAGTPGYALCAWRNEAEERYMETLDEYLELVAERGTSPHGHQTSRGAPGRRLSRSRAEGCVCSAEAVAAVAC